MWSCVGQTIQMVEGDYGLELPIIIHGATFAAGDSVRLKIARGDDVLLEKEFSDIAQNTITLTLTKAESELLPIGTYCYGLDWYQDGVFMCNVVQRSTLRVVDKL